jgi:hypothetical protein
MVIINNDWTGIYKEAATLIFMLYHISKYSPGRISNG